MRCSERAPPLVLDLGILHGHLDAVLALRLLPGGELLGLAFRPRWLQGRELVEVLEEWLDVPEGHALEALVAAKTVVLNRQRR